MFTISLYHFVWQDSEKKSKIKFMFLLQGAQKILFILIPFFFFSCTKKDALITPLSIPEVVTPEVLLKRVNLSSFQTVRSAMKLSIHIHGQPKGTYSGVLLFRYPDLLNIRVFSFFGFTFMEAVFNRGTLQILVPSQDTLYSGSLSFGRLFSEDRDIAASIKILKKIENNRYVLSIYEHGVSAKDIKAKYFFDSNDLSWKGAEFYSEGRKITNIEIYKTYGLFPSDIEIYAQGASFHLELKDIAVNEQLSDRYFMPLRASRMLPLSKFLQDYGEQAELNE